ncbi:hypothetical protein DY000_02012398 [Brassica cretica]|uniref:Uncharacterized protein n=1 Tax=Brassica cretica TaxID=69181 RepID=A0ABQ7D119_BRACR|nr:hypothetical protein DY000_02012398 [Brassica cretica]
MLFSPMRYALLGPERHHFSSCLIAYQAKTQMLRCQAFHHRHTCLLLMRNHDTTPAAAELITSTASRSNAPFKLSFDQLLLRTWFPSCVVFLTMSPSPSALSALCTRRYCLGVTSLSPF